MKIKKTSINANPAGTLEIEEFKNRMRRAFKGNLPKGSSKPKG
ncbi:MAG TPA: hypothetical protein PK728_05840 [Bacillota bacterium]|nr:hypothetical protein [Bacillota bacterium]